MQPGERFRPEGAELINYSNELIDAMRAKDVGTMVMLLHSKTIDINARNDEGVTPLIAAVVDGDVGSLVLLLRDKRIDVGATDKDGHTAFWHANKLDDLGMKMLLLRKERPR